MGLLAVSLLLGVLFVYSSAECKPGNRGKRILYGDRIDIGEAPFMASLMEVHEGHQCGGTLIDKQWILTAAHCFDDQKVPDASTWRVSLGVTGQKKYKDGLAVSHIILHKGYKRKDPKARNDIALVRLKNAAVKRNKKPNKKLNKKPNKKPNKKLNKKLNNNWTKNIKRANLIKKGEELTKPCSVYGWASDGILRTASRELLSDQECKKLDGFYKSTTEMCTYSMIHCGQHGDSGGPLMCRVKTGKNTFARRLVGVRSSGTGKGKPDIYTRVSGFLTWIDQKMNAIYN